ncbi:MAG: hypothetical protein M1813_009707 [Trichoglossum hirsutum]|nr:MAG: hypothetical protein M1813_009707 [Trichoglossum hirsutum]
MASQTFLNPTYVGHVETTNDALILFEAVLREQLEALPRRPEDRERAALIRSGSVLIYEESTTGISRWTDGVLWSPSRGLGDFFVYRELKKPLPKKKVTKRENKKTTKRDKEKTSEWDKRVGSLVDSYDFKEGGLVRKAISVKVNGVRYRLVSYYAMEDVASLETPSESDCFRLIEPRLELTSSQNFHALVESPTQAPHDHGAISNFNQKLVSNGQSDQASQPSAPPQTSFPFCGTEAFLISTNDPQQPSTPTSYSASALSPIQPFYNQSSRDLTEIYGHTSYSALVSCRPLQTWPGCLDAPIEVDGYTFCGASVPCPPLQTQLDYLDTRAEVSSYMSYPPQSLLGYPDTKEA